MNNSLKSYYNYHATAKRLIEEGQLTAYELKDSYRGISPALVLFFYSHIPMPIRKERFGEYFDLIGQFEKENRWEARRA